MEYFVSPLEADPRSTALSRAKVTMESFLTTPRLVEHEPLLPSPELFVPTERNCALALAAGVERDVAAFVRFFSLLRSSHHEFAGFLDRNADWWNQQRRGDDEEEDAATHFPPGMLDELGMPPVLSILHLAGHVPAALREADNRCFGCLDMTKKGLVEAGARVLQLAPNLEGTVVGAMLMDAPGGLGESHFALCACCTPQHYHVPNPSLLNPVGILAGFLGNTPLVARLHEEREVLFARSSAMWGIVEGSHVDVLFYFIREVFCQYVSSPTGGGGGGSGGRRPDSPVPGMEWGNPTTPSLPQSSRQRLGFHCLKEAICAVPLVDRRRTIESVVLESGRPEMVRAIQIYRTEHPSRPPQVSSTRATTLVGGRGPTRSESDDSDASV